MGRPKGPRGQARQRVLDAALALFVEYGVSGTSLQMIADRLEVTKAAVYHQFPAKGDIALALLENLFTGLDELVDAAEQAPAEARTALAVRRIVAMMVDQRQVMSAMYRDPEMERVIAAHPSLSGTVERLNGLLNPPEVDTLRRRIGWSVLGAGLTHAVVDPEFADVPDDDLKLELLRLAHRILD